jgi:hypothetical protein
MTLSILAVFCISERRRDQPHFSWSLADPLSVREPRYLTVAPMAL